MDSGSPLRPTVRPTSTQPWTLGAHLYRNSQDLTSRVTLDLTMDKGTNVRAGGFRAHARIGNSGSLIRQLAIGSLLTTPSLAVLQFRPRIEENLGCATGVVCQPIVSPHSPHPLNPLVTFGYRLSALEAVTPWETACAYSDAWFWGHRTEARTQAQPR